MTCPDCIEANRRAKSRGFRNRNKDGEYLFACFEHAAVDWNAWVAAGPIDVSELGQPDLFLDVA